MNLICTEMSYFCQPFKDFTKITQFFNIEKKKNKIEYNLQVSSAMTSSLTRSVYGQGVKEYTLGPLFTGPLGGKG